MKKIPLRLLLCSIPFSLLFINQSNAQNQGQFQPQVLPGVPNPPGPITGPTSVTAPTISQYSVPAIVPGITLNWRLTPTTAGSISFNINQATVNWSSTFSGSATVSCTAANSYGSSAPSNLTVTVTPPPITCSVAPTSPTCSYNKTPASIKGTVSGGTVYTYQWQSSTNNVTWTPISGATGINYSPGALTANTYYQLVATSGSSGKAISQTGLFCISRKQGSLG